MPTFWKFLREVTHDSVSSERGASDFFTYRRFVGAEKQRVSTQVIACKGSHCPGHGTCLYRGLRERFAPGTPKSMNTKILRVIVAAAGVSAFAPALAAAGEVNADTGSFIVLGSGSRLPATLARDVAALGGKVESSVSAVGMAVVRLDRMDAYAVLKGLSGVSDVAADVVVQWQDPNPRTAAIDAAEDAVSAQGYGDTETFRNLQWAPDAVSAPVAWEAGYRGAGARIAILDGGIHSNHVDIAPNLDIAHSASFVPGQPFNADTGTFWHGTHVAGIAAAPGQGIGTVGIAPDATLVGVKVLQGGSGAFSWILQGIVYAATPINEGGAGANVINMSLGAGFSRQGRDAASLANAISRVTMYARQRGAVVVAAAGNSAVDLDHTANLVFFPAQAAGVISVAATGPMGWALGADNVDRPASYSNHGQSAITVAAPGGDDALPGNDVCAVPRNPSGTVYQYCWVLDMVMAPCRGSASSTTTYCWADGTSMASPVVAGVAALIIGKYGPMRPAQVEAILRKSADDLGKPGNDDDYGRGRVNAGRAVQ